MGEPDQDVTEYIEKSIESLEGDQPDRKFDERMLYAPVAVLQPRAPILVDPETLVSEAVVRMREERVGCVLVQHMHKLKGIFTERDLLTKVVAAGLDPATLPIRKVMTANPEYLRASDSVAHALNKMSIGGYRHVPIVDEAIAPSGVVTVGDIVGYLVRFFPKSVLNLPAFPRGNYAREREGA